MPQLIITAKDLKNVAKRNAFSQPPQLELYLDGEYLATIGEQGVFETGIKAGPHVFSASFAQWEVIVTKPYQFMIGEGDVKSICVLPNYNRQSLIAIPVFCLAVLFYFLTKILPKEDLPIVIGVFGVLNIIYISISLYLSRGALLVKDVSNR